MKTVYIIIAFCIGLLAGYLLFPVETDIKSPKTIEFNGYKKQITEIDKKFSYHKIIFQKQNDSLFREIKRFKFLLAISNRELITKRKKTSVLLTKLKNNYVLQSNSLLFDSLQQQLISTDSSADSLIAYYQNKDSLATLLLAIKDSQIVMCNQSFVKLRDLTQEQILREQKLTEDLNAILKQQKRKRYQNKILSAGMLFISGITTILYIKSRQ